jgi:hypothetical protein
MAIELPGYFFFVDRVLAFFSSVIMGPFEPGEKLAVADPVFLRGFSTRLLLFFFAPLPAVATVALFLAFFTLLLVMMPLTPFVLGLRAAFITPSFGTTLLTPLVPGPKAALMTPFFEMPLLTPLVLGLNAALTAFFAGAAFWAFDFFLTVFFFTAILTGFFI